MDWDQPSTEVSNACESGKMQELGLSSLGLPTWWVDGERSRGEAMGKSICGEDISIHRYVANLQAKKLSSSSRLEGAGKGAPGPSWVGSCT